MNQELPDVQVEFRKVRRIKDQIAKIHWIIEKKQKNSRKTSASASLTMLKPLTVWIIKNCRKFFKRDGNIRSFYLSPDKYVCKTRNNSRIRHGTMDWFKIGKGVYQDSILSQVYLTNMITSCEMPGWLNHRLESRLPAEILTTSNIQMILF